jgi:hypothetical protein
MASIVLSDDELVVRLTMREKLASLHGDVRVRSTLIQNVGVEPQPFTALRSLGAPGLSILGLTKIGTWRSFRHHGFAAARRGVPAVRVWLVGAEFDDLLISTPDADAIADAIRTRCWPTTQLES